jgi:hypothetical protein
LRGVKRAAAQPDLLQFGPLDAVVQRAKFAQLRQKSLSRFGREAPSRIERDAAVVFRAKC